MRALLDTIRRAWATVEGSPAYQRFDTLAEPYVRRLLGYLRLPQPWEQRAEPFLELGKARQTKAAPVGALLIVMAALGIYASPLGHLDTTPYIWQILPFASGINPGIGFLAAVVFSAFDWIGKWLPFESVYGANPANGWGNYLGARLGYLCAYSTILTLGVLPGVTARVFRTAVPRLLSPLLKRRGARAAAAVFLVAAAGAFAFWFQGPAALLLVIGFVVLAAAQPPAGGGAGIDPDLAARLAGIAAGASGGVLGTFASMQLYSAVGTDLAFTTFRTDLDTSCRALARGNTTSNTPGAAGAGGAGGGAGGGNEPIYKKPKDYKKGKDVWTPPLKKQRDMWEKEGVVWDPETLSWRRPGPGELPPPEDETPYEKQNPRHTIPRQCLGLYDAYANLQRQVINAESQVQQLAGKHDKAVIKHSNNFMKFSLLTGWDVGSLVGGGASGIRGAGKGVGRPGISGPGLGIIKGLKARLAALQARLAQLSSRASRLTDEILRLAREIPLARRLGRELAEAADELITRADDLAAKARELTGKVKDLGGKLKQARLFRALKAEKEQLWTRYREMLKRRDILKRQLDLDGWVQSMKGKYSGIMDRIQQARKRILEVRPAIAGIEAEMDSLRLFNQNRVMFDDIGKRLSLIDDQVAALSKLGTKGGEEMNRLLNLRRSLEIERARLYLPDGRPPPVSVITDEARYLRLQESLRQLEKEMPNLEATLALDYKSFDEFLALEDGGRYQAWRLEVAGQEGALRAQWDELATSTKAATQKIDKIEVEMGNLKRQVGDATPEGLEAEVKAARSELSTTQNQERLAREQAALKRAEVPGAEEQAKRLEGQRDISQRELNGVNQDLESARTDIQQVEQQIVDAQRPGASDGSVTGAITTLLTQAGDKFQKTFGGQSQGAIARLLVEGYNYCQQLKAALEAARAQQDAAQKGLRPAKAQLDRCLETHKIEVPEE